MTHAHVTYPDDAGPGPGFYRLLAPGPDATWRGSGRNGHFSRRVIWLQVNKTRFNCITNQATPGSDNTTLRCGDPDSARLKINIPETCVFSEFSSSTYYTSETGSVIRRDDLKSKVGTVYKLNPVDP